jgi:uncharacterized protein YcfL
MKKLLLIISTLGVLSGCARTFNADSDKIFFTGQSGAGYIQSISVDESRPNKDELKKITIHGMAYVDATVYYSVVWFDRDHVKLNTTLSKSTLEHLRKNQPFYWSAVAPNQKAVDYKVYISDRAL